MELGKVEAGYVAQAAFRVGEQAQEAGVLPTFGTVRVFGYAHGPAMHLPYGYGQSQRRSPLGWCGYALKSRTGLPKSRTLRDFWPIGRRASLVECASRLALWNSKACATGLDKVEGKAM
jgi:hypothetical protein